MARTTKKNETTTNAEAKEQYIVLCDFYDKNDGTLYAKGERFPRAGVEVTPERFLELASNENNAKKPLIKKE